MSSDDWVNVDFSDPVSVARFEEFAEKRRDILLEVSATSYERGTAYSNLIILAGYAGSFSVWALVKDDDILSPRATAAVGTFLGLSLLVFVTFEIWKMIELSNRGIRVGTILRRKQSAEAFLRELAEFCRSEQEQDLTVSASWWMANVWAAIIFAAPGITILFYSMLAPTMGWPRLWQ